MAVIGWVEKQEKQNTFTDDPLRSSDDRRAPKHSPRRHTSTLECRKHNAELRHVQLPRRSGKRTCAMVAFSAQAGVLAPSQEGHRLCVSFEQNSHDIIMNCN